MDAASPHLGNPPVSAFECESTLPGDSYDVPQCLVEDYVSANVREHVECSNHGRCDHDLGVCECRQGWRNANCDDNQDTGAVETFRAPGPF